MPRAARLDARFIPVPLGVSTLQVVAVDRAGNSDPAQVRTWTITRSPAAPMLRFLVITTAKAETDGRTLTVAGHDAPRFTASTPGELVVHKPGRSVRVVRRG